MLTHDPGTAFADLIAAYAGDPRLHVPATVYNAIRNRPEPVLDEDRARVHPLLGPEVELVHLRNVGYGCYNFAVRATG